MVSAARGKVRKKKEVRLTWEKSKKQEDESNERGDVKVEMKGQRTGLMRGQWACSLLVVELMTGIKRLLRSPGSARFQTGPPSIPGDLRESDSIWPKIS